MNLELLAADIVARVQHSPDSPANLAEVVKSLIEQGKAKLPLRPVSAEEWWSQHAELLSVKMQRGGVKSFRVELTPRGTYEYEVTPL